MTTTANGSAVHDAAIRYCQRGLPVVPNGGDNGKKPIGGDGWQHKTWSEADITEVFSRQQDLNVGIKCGPSSGIIDIEADSDAEEAVFAELFSGADIPVTPTFTSTRGKHRLFAWHPRFGDLDTAVLNYKGTNGAKLGIRIGAGDKAAQSVVPPSTGRKWLVDLDACEPAQLPDAVVDRIIAAAAKPPAQRQHGTSSGTFHAAALSAMLRMEVADVGDGSKRLFACACRAVEHDLDDQQAIATVRKYEKQRPFPTAWSDDDIAKRLRSAEQKVERGADVVLSNGRQVEVKVKDADGNELTKQVLVPMTMTEVIDQLNATTDDWPRRVDSVLFVDDSQHGIGWLEKQAALFGWMRRQAKVVWHRGIKYVDKSELFEELRRTSQQYDAVEVLPHFPPFPKHYYRCAVPEAGDGEALRQLVKRFRPETTADADLIVAAIITTFWGGPAGTRPAFVITSDDGRGAGKTKLAEVIAYLAGGYIDVSAGEDIATLKQRFLSPEALVKRVAVLDNVKSHGFSWGELESLITAPIISGKRMYVGEASRPNTLTWFITLNGVSLSTDMAQRSVVIKIVKGENSGTWYEDTLRFIDEHRDAIIGDVRAVLESEPFPLASFSRWAAWERDVLQRLPEPGDAQQVILERQGDSNVDHDEAHIVQDYIAERLKRLDYLPTFDQVRIPVEFIGKWYCDATNQRQMKTQAVTRRLNQMIAEQQVKRLRHDPCRTYGRCFIWTGESADESADIKNDLRDRQAIKVA